MQIGKIILKLTELAEEADMSVDKYMKAIAVHERNEQKQEEARSASSEDKSKIDEILAQMNGTLSEDITPLDILAKAGVQRKQGTMSYARYQTKQLLLTHQSN
jgi:hypothetical protein